MAELDDLATSLIARIAVEWLRLETLEVRMLEDRSLDAVMWGDGVVKRTCEASHDAVHVTHLEEQAFCGARLPILRFVADGDAEPNPLRFLEHLHDRRVTKHKVCVAHGGGILCLAAAVPKPVLPFVGALRVRGRLREERT